MIYYALFLLITSYLIVCSALYFFQEKVIFYPEPLPNDYLFRFEHPFEENDIKVAEKVTLNTLFFKTQKSKGCVLYHHGNARNLADWALNYTDFIKNGYDVLFYDYRGFGKSTGKIISEKQLIEDAEKMNQWLIDHYAPVEIIQYGRSLGSGVATQLAQKVLCNKLILETPYYSILDMAKKSFKLFPINYLLKYNFLTNQHLKKVKAPIYLIHGTEDEMIEITHSERLYRENPSAKFFVIVGGTHNNLPGFAKYQECLAEILKIN